MVRHQKQQALLLLFQPRLELASHPETLVLFGPRNTEFPETTFQRFKARLLVIFVYLINIKK